jgi:hypothetical protein
MTEHVLSLLQNPTILFLEDTPARHSLEFSSGDHPAGQKH